MLQDASLSVSLFSQTRSPLQPTHTRFNPPTPALSSERELSLYIEHHMTCSKSLLFCSVQSPVLHPIFPARVVARAFAMLVFQRAHRGRPGPLRPLGCDSRRPGGPASEANVASEGTSRNGGPSEVSAKVSAGSRRCSHASPPAPPARCQA